MSTLPRYERPVLVRHQTGLMNKFVRSQALSPLTHIDGVSVQELIETYGSPLIVFSERTIAARYRELRDALALRYPRVRLAWSYKTNYLEAICRIFHREGAYAEVVSDMEYDKALRHGVPAERIHFNGPYKPHQALERALLAGSPVHIDHFDELSAAEQIATELDIRPKVALRINFRSEVVPYWGRFGFSLDDGQARDAVARLIAGGKLELVGLHTHIGTFIVDPEAYRAAAERMAQFANELLERHGIKLEFIDLGGGLASHNTLKAQYLPGAQATPNLGRYAEAILDGLGALSYSPRDLPTLVLESGRALIDDAGYLISTVHATKRLSDGRRALVLDAGVNTLFTSFWYKHDVYPAQSFHGSPEPTVMFGPLCMNIDVMRETMLYPPMSVGDRLVFRTVGAYNVTQWMQFITYRPAVVLIGSGGQHALIRRREDLEAIVNYEETPSWL